jgi:hypothetical protein
MFAEPYNLAWKVHHYPPSCISAWTSRLLLDRHAEADMHTKPKLRASMPKLFGMGTFRRSSTSQSLKDSPLPQQRREPCKNMMSSHVRECRRAGIQWIRLFAALPDARRSRNGAQQFNSWRRRRIRNPWGEATINNSRRMQHKRMHPCGIVVRAHGQACAAPKDRSGQHRRQSADAWRRHQCRNRQVHASRGHIRHGAVRRCAAPFSVLPRAGAKG